MLKTQWQIRSILKEPSAFVPIAMSVLALALLAVKVGGDLATQGRVVHEADEGAIAHSWQLLMAGQLPIVAYFAIRWLPRAGTPAFSVLAMQLGAAIASFATVFLLGL